MENERANHLVKQYLEGNMNSDEQLEFDLLLQEPGNAAGIYSAFDVLSGDINISSNVDEKVFSLLQKATLADKPEQPGKTKPAITAHPVHRVHFLKRSWLRYAAAVIILLGAGFYFWQKNSTSGLIADQQKEAEILPGTNKATLTLADGSKILLDTVNSGEFASQGTTKISLVKAGQLAYEKTSGDPNAGMNTISTPRGGQYQVVLPDGSQVWLNAASSITFQAGFFHNRTVEVTGEVYFEVAPLKNSPFIVTAKKTSVQVLGTGFNINAYDDENEVRTTLVQGSINVSGGKDTKTILPGQQAVTQLNTASDIEIMNVDTELQTAWKNHVFSFEKASIRTIMRQLARWYDIEVIYNGNVNERFNATMPMDQPISKILNLLDTTSLVKFKTKGKTIIVQ